MEFDIANLQTSRLASRHLRNAIEELPRGESPGVEAGETARKFEEIFLRMIMREMLPKEDGAFFGKSVGAGVYKDLFVGAVAEQMSDQGALGIKEIIEKQIARVAGDTARNRSEKESHHDIHA